MLISAVPFSTAQYKDGGNKSEPRGRQCGLVYTIEADCSTATSGFVFKVLIQAPFSIGTVLVLIYRGIRKNPNDTQPYSLFILSVSRLWKMHRSRTTHSFRHTAPAVRAAPQTVQESLRSCAECSKPVIILWFSLSTQVCYYTPNFPYDVSKQNMLCSVKRRCLVS